MPLIVHNLALQDCFFILTFILFFSFQFKYKEVVWQHKLSCTVNCKTQPRVLIRTHPLGEGSQTVYTYSFTIRLLSQLASGCTHCMRLCIKIHHIVHIAATLAISFQKP